MQIVQPFASAIEPRLRALEDRMTLRQQVAIAAGLLCFLIVAVLAGGAAYIGRSQGIESAERQVSSLAQTLADRLDRRMAWQRRQAILIAGLKPLIPVWNGDAAAIRPVLEQIKAADPHAAWVGIATPDGIVKAATGGHLEGRSVADRPWFRHGVNQPTVEDVYEAKMMASLLRGTGSEPLRFVDIAVPLKDREGKTVGVLGFHLNWSLAADLRRSTLAPLNPDLHTDISILSREGTVLLGPSFGRKALAGARLAKVSSEGAGTFQETDASGEKFTGFAVADGTPDSVGLGWIVLARQPAKIALAPAQHLEMTILLLGLSVGCCGILAAMLIAGKVSTPLLRLTSHADRLGRDASRTMPRMHGCYEVVALSGALRSLVRRLGFAEQRTTEVQLRAADEAQRYIHDLDHLRRLADLDPLTSLLNRRGFLAFAEDIMGHYRRYGRPFAILMIDIDHFKRVNDEFGHAAGDAVIHRIGSVIATSIRPTDKVARFGGEEFIVLLREIDSEAAVEIAERIRLSIAETAIVFGDTQLPATVSIGIAIVSPDHRDLQDVIADADLALYTAKNGGRNQVASTQNAMPQRQIA